MIDMVEKKSWLNEHLATIIVALFSLIATTLGAWFVYNQSTKDKMTDYKIEQMKLFNEEKLNTNNRNVTIIYSELYDLLNNLDVDRVYIIQPHPEVHHYYLSVRFEVDEKGVAPVKDIFQNIPISDVPKFSRQIATNNWSYISNIYEQVDDNRILSMMRTMGTTNIAIYQLVDASGEWNGSLVVGNIKGKNIEEDKTIKLMKNAANTIQYILPPITF
jgi:hypothetical protein